MSTKTLRELIAQGKPEKPYPEFPLFAHPSGRWAKKIRGTVHYFGKWDEPQTALDDYMSKKDCLHAGRTPRMDPEKATVKDICNHFLNHKQALVDSGELSKLTFSDYKTACDVVISVCGKNRLADDIGPLDFAEMRAAMSRRWGLCRLQKMIVCIRSLFQYSIAARLILSTIAFGPSFSVPSKSAFRRMRAAQGKQDLPRELILDILEHASPCLRACVLLGINAGLGNADCGSITLESINLETGMVDFAREKTGIPRRFALWPETIAAIAQLREIRIQEHKAGGKDTLLVTRTGGSWNRDGAGKMLTTMFRRAIERINPDIAKRIGFYSLRRTFRTIADQCQDQPAIFLVMGHDDGSMANVYRQWIDDTRLRRVSEHVRQWLFGVKTDSSHASDSSDDNASRLVASCSNERQETTQATLP